MRTRMPYIPIVWFAIIGALATFALPQNKARAQDKAVAVSAVKAADRVGADRYAVIIGINDYTDPKIPDLKFAENDAHALYDLLTDPHTGGIAPENATLLLGKKATKREVLKALNNLSTIPKNATVFIFFSGHGAKESGDAFWVTVDAELGGLGFSAVPDREIQTLTSRIPSERLIMLLDCCYAAATVKEQKSIVDLTDTLKRFTGKGRVTITASGSGEEAIEAEDLQHGVFVHYLLQGMRGKADGLTGMPDGVVTIPELTEYIDRTVADAARQRKGIQKPEIMQDVTEPGKFLITIDPVRIAAIETPKRLNSERVRAQLQSLKNLFIKEKITADQYRLGKQLVATDPEKLDPQDRERLDLFRELLNDKLPPKRLQALLDSIETPEQRTARMERRRLAQMVKGKLSKLQTAYQAKDASAAWTQYEALKKLAPDNAQVLAWAKKLESLPRPVVIRGKEMIIALGGGVNLALVLLPSGDFQMGSPEDEEYRGSGEGPVHRVRIGKAFYMGQTEVTQSQWQAVMGETPSSFKGSGDLPVEQVSWDDCQAFCKKLSAKTGRAVRLPSESEWEYGCRAGSRRAYSFGDSADELEGYAWFNDNSDKKTHAVGGKRANGWGLYDMHGNVWEWCADVYHKSYSGAPTDGSAWTRGGDEDVRVLRGGSWDLNYRGNLRSATRYWSTRDYRFDYIGFRVVVFGVSPGTP